MGKNKKLILVITLILLISFFITSIISYFVALDSIRNQISRKQLPLTSDNVYSEVQNDLLKPIFISSLMATDTFVRDWIINGEEGTEQITKYLKEIKKKYGVFTSFLVSEKTNNYYYTSGILKQVKKEEERDKWYFRVKEMKNDYEINVDIDMANNDYLTIFINYKVYDYKSNYIGATGVGLKVDNVKILLENYQKNYNSKIYFVDKKGNIKLSSFKKEDRKENIYEIVEMKKIANDILKNNQKELYYNYKGNRVLLNSRYIPEFDWYLIVEQEEGRDVKILLETFIINLLICFLVVLLVVLIIYRVLNKYQKELQKMALFDKLTDIYNRQAFDIMIEEAIKYSKRNNIKFSVMIFDIDNFKKINDEYGHLTGDKVIKKIAEISKKTIREIDNIFRWGGDEFFVILKNCDVENACLVAEKIRKNINDYNFKDMNKLNINISISGGIAEYNNEENLESVIKRADEKLYEAKLKGKNKVMPKGKE